MEVPFRLKESFIPPFKIDPNILKGNRTDPGKVFKIPEELEQKYKDRLEELRLNKEALAKSTASHNEILTQKAELEAKRRSRNSVQMAEMEQLRKIQELINRCQGLTDFESAKFYLEAQNWDLTKAANFYAECTGNAKALPPQQIEATFNMPENFQFKATFDPDQLLWSILPKVYENLRVKRDFAVKIGGRVIQEQEMTQYTFKAFRMPQKATIHIEYT